MTTENTHPAEAMETISGPSRAAMGGEKILVRPRLMVFALGLAQIFGWGSTFYLPAVLAAPIAADMGWSLAIVVGGFSLALVISGIAAPKTGRLIAQYGGRPVMISGFALLAGGLGLLGASTNLATYFLAWAVIGIGMSASLYDAAFSALGRILGGGARKAITTITLFGGFASTICWPLSALLVAELGWREAVWAYAAIHLFVALPLLALALPRERPSSRLDPAGIGNAAAIARPDRYAMILLGSALIAGGLIFSMVSVHLIALLQAGGLSFATAVGLAAVIGPAQVAGRLVEMALGQRHHPLWTLISAAVLIMSGLALLGLGIPIPAAALVLYGAGNGIWSIAKGTVPLALFGRECFPIVIGRMAMPVLVVQAAAPTIGAVMMNMFGGQPTLMFLAGLGLLNVIFAGVLMRAHARAR